MPKASARAFSGLRAGFFLCLIYIICVDIFKLIIIAKGRAQGKCSTSVAQFAVRWGQRGVPTDFAPKISLLATNTAASGAGCSVMMWRVAPYSASYSALYAGIGWQRAAGFYIKMAALVSVLVLPCSSGFLPLFLWIFFAASGQYVWHTLLMVIIDSGSGKKFPSPASCLVRRVWHTSAA